MIPEDFTSALKDPLALINFVASMAYYTQHGNLTASGIKAIKEQPGGTVARSSRKRNFDLFTVIVSK